MKFAKNEIEANQDGEPAGYRPMYYTHSYPEDMQKIEMSFDCTNYQHQFRMDHDAPKPPIPYENHIFQSIFLDKTNKDLWTIDQIDPSKVIESKWWHQLGHRWQHYVRVVPGMMFLNGKRSTWFAGSWTLVVSLLRHDHVGPSNTMLTISAPRTCTKWPAYPAWRRRTGWVQITRSLTT